MSTLRRVTLPLLLALDLLLVAALAGFVWLDNAANRGITFAPAPPPIPRGGPPAVGVNLFNLHLEPDPAAVTRTFELAAGMGARFARMQAPWDDIEIHGRGDFEDRRNLDTVGPVSAWAKYDRIAAAANAAGVELIWRLERPPEWARQRAEADPAWREGLQRDGNSMAPPDDLADYAAFVGAVVERYDGDGADDAPGSPTVRHFQLWNEPNLKNEWGWRAPSPEEFVALLRAGATAAREASPEAVVLFPGLAPTDGLDRRAPLTELEYLDRVYKAGGAAFFDVMAAQGYGLGQPPDEHRYVFLRGRDNWSWRRPIDTRNDVSRVVLLREVMLANDDGDTPVWITEFGWNAAPESIPPERRFTWGPPVSEETKGAYLVGQLERARTEWPWMGVMNVWMLRYGGYAEPDPADPTPYFALVSRDWRTLPAYDALRAYTAAPLPNEAPARTLGPLWDYGLIPLVLALMAAGAATLAHLFPALDRARAGLRAAQLRARGRPGLLARLIQPDALIFGGMLLGAAVAYRASAQLPITLAGLALFAALSLLRPDLGLLLVPLALPLYFIPKGIFDARFGIRDSGIYLPLHEILLLVVLAAAAARALWELARGGPRSLGLPAGAALLARERLWAAAPVALFVLAGLWGVLAAGDRGPALRELRWLILGPLLFVGLALVFARWRAAQGGGDYWGLVLRCWLIGGAASGLVAALQLLGLNLAPLFGTKAGFSEDSFLVEGVRRVSGLYGHPNNLGLAMGRYWPVAAALAHGAFWGAPTRREGLRRALPWALVAGLCIAGLLASFSRGAYLGAAVAAAVLAALLLPRGLWRDRRVLLGLGALAALGLLAAAAVAALNIERFNPFGASSGIRLRTWASALAMLRDAPLGIGLDQFGRLYPQYIDPALAGTNEINTAHPHTLLLDIPLRLGPLGVVAFAWLIARFFADVRRGLARPAAVAQPWLPETSPRRALLVGLAAAMAGALVHGLVDQFYFWPDLAFAFWLLVALARPGALRDS
jgi:hypothetical protein